LTPPTEEIELQARAASASTVIVNTKRFMINLQQL